MKRKLLGALLSVAMVASLLVGCGSDGGSTTTTADSATTETNDNADAATDTAADDSADTAADTEADTDAAADTAAAGGKIGISMPTQSLERWNRDGAYLDEQFKAAGFETILTYSDNKSEQQVNDIQNMLAEDVDLLIIAAIDGGALNTVLNEAAEADIPVISYDRLILNDAVSYYVSFDNYTVGQLPWETPSAVESLEQSHTSSCVPSA